MPPAPSQQTSQEEEGENLSLFEMYNDRFRRSVFYSVYNFPVLLSPRAPGHVHRHTCITSVWVLYEIFRLEKRKILRKPHISERTLKVCRTTKSAFNFLHSVFDILPKG